MDMLLHSKAKSYFEHKIAEGAYSARLMHSASDILASDGVKQVLEYLREHHQLALDCVLMSNPKAPDYLIVIHGVLPIEDLKQKFEGVRGLVFTEYEAFWKYHYISLIGSGAVE